MNDQIAPIEYLENHYREILKKDTEPYPTLTDFDVKTPLEILEKYPIVPAFLTIIKFDRFYTDLTTFLKLQKPLLNLPQTQQKELIRYIIDIVVDYIPQHVKGNNVLPRESDLWNARLQYKRDVGGFLINHLELSFTEKDLNTCPRCGYDQCYQSYPLCENCHYPRWRCETDNFGRHGQERTCRFCGTVKGDCVEHIYKPD